MLENNNAVLAVVDPVYPGTALRPGSSGSEVARMQTYLNGLRPSASKYAAAQPMSCTP